MNFIKNAAAIAADQQNQIEALTKRLEKVERVIGILDDEPVKEAEIPEPPEPVAEESIEDVKDPDEATMVNADPPTTTRKRGGRGRKKS